MMVMMIMKITVDNDEEDHSQRAWVNMLKAQITQRAAATQAKAGQTKTRSGRLNILRGFAAINNHLFAGIYVWVTSGKCLHSFELRFFFCDQSFESHGISCYVYGIGPGILHILFYLCQIRVTASKADVTNCFCLIWWFCILFGTIVFV